MACGSSVPLAKTLSPRRVTSRSSWRVSRRPRTALAILSRTEFEPISTAAKVGMQFQIPVSACETDGPRRRVIVVRACRAIHKVRKIDAPMALCNRCANGFRFWEKSSHNESPYIHYIATRLMRVEVFCFVAPVWPQLRPTQAPISFQPYGRSEEHTSELQ